MIKKREVRQGDVFMVSIHGSIGSEQSIFGRPCLIIQNDIGNECSKTTIILPLTKRTKKQLPTHYVLKKEDYPFLGYDSLVLGEQIRCIDMDKRLLERKIGTIKEADLNEILKIVSNNFY